jgi:hypothetical protein
MRKFQVGDTVVMSEEGRIKYRDRPDNPHHLQGTVNSSRDAPDAFSFCLNVIWDNGEFNGYRTIDLEFVNLIVENE